MTVAWLLGDRWAGAGSAAWTLAGCDADTLADLLADQPGRALVAGRGNDAAYQVVAGLNDKIPFDEGGGTLTATITPGYYTPTTFSAEAKTQMEAVGALTYTVSAGQAVSGIASFGATGNFILKWSSGAAGVAKLARALGFDLVDTSNAALHPGDRVVIGNTMNAVIDAGSSVTPAAIIVQQSASDEGTPDYAGLTLYGNPTDLGPAVNDWDGTATEYVPSTQSANPDAPIRSFFQPLATAVARRYYLVSWVWDDDCLSHAINLARMWSTADFTWTGAGGNTVQSDMRIGPVDLGGRMVTDNAYPAAGLQAWEADATAKDWPVASYLSTLLAVQRWGPRAASLFLADADACLAGNAATWLAQAERGQLLWSTTVIAPATVSGSESAYRSAAISVRQLR